MHNQHSRLALLTFFEDNYVFLEKLSSPINKIRLRFEPDNPFLTLSSIMQLTEAIALIQHNDYDSARPSTWADLGCGTGLFTRALATRQPPGSVIYALDTDQTALRQLTNYNEVIIRTVCQDFVQAPWSFGPVDGLLMANSLHYVKDKPAFLEKAQGYLIKSGYFLLIEYDTDTANPWVPYPLSFLSLKHLFNTAGYSFVEKLHEMPSRYQRANLYSVLVKR